MKAMFQGVNILLLVPLVGVSLSPAQIVVRIALMLRQD